MQTFYKVCLILMIIGGINWGLWACSSLTLWAGCWAAAAPSGRASCLRWWAWPLSAASRGCLQKNRKNKKRLLHGKNVQQPFFVDHSVIPTHQIGQGEGLIRAVGVCGAVGGAVAFSTARTISLMAAQSSGRSVWLRPEWVNRILPRWPTTSVSGSSWGLWCRSGNRHLWRPCRSSEPQSSSSAGRGSALRPGSRTARRTVADDRKGEI